MKTPGIGSVLRRWRTQILCMTIAGAAKEAGISPKLAQLQMQLMKDGIATLATKEGKLYREIMFEEFIALPPTWLVRRSNGRAYAASQAGRTGVGLPSDSWEGDNKISGMLFFTYAGLLTDFVFIDGTPFGVEVLLDEDDDKEIDVPPMPPVDPSFLKTHDEMEQQFRKATL